jgi:hypothetical protein
VSPVTPRAPTAVEELEFARIGTIHAFAEIFSTSGRSRRGSIHSGDNGDLKAHRLNPMRMVDHASLNPAAIEVADGHGARSFGSLSTVGGSPAC